MENIIYNELLIRGYNVDVGVVEYSYYEDKKRKQNNWKWTLFVIRAQSEFISSQHLLYQQ